MSDEMVIFTRTFDLLLWLLPKAERFPKLYRSTVTQRLLDAALDFQEALLEAAAYDDKIRLRHLRQADAHLDKVRLYLRLVHRWGWLSHGQYEHVSRQVAEVGRLPGGWLRQAQGGQAQLPRRPAAQTGEVEIIRSRCGGSESRPCPGFLSACYRRLPHGRPACGNRAV